MALAAGHQRRAVQWKKAKNASQLSSRVGPACAWAAPPRQPSSAAEHVLQVWAKVLVDLLAAENSRTAEGADAVGVGTGLLSVGARLSHGSSCLRHFGLHALSGKSGQHLSALHHIADVHQHLSQS
jgi:hypothetical protein